MGFEFKKYLSAEQMRTILNQRIQQFAAEAYQQEMNKRLAIDTQDDNGITQASNILAVLEHAINLHVNELNTLDGEGGVDQ